MFRRAHPPETDLALVRERLAGLHRRSAVRYGCGPTVRGQLTVAEIPQSQEAVICNLSEGGLCLRLPGPLVVGTMLVLRLCAPDGNALTLPAQVVHANPDLDGTCRIGCAFVKRLTSDALAMLRTGDPPTTTSPW